MKKACYLGFVVSLLHCYMIAAQTRASGFQVVNKFVVGGAGGWDYISYDAGTKRLFVAHNEEIVVVDSATGKRIGSMHAHGAHGIALVPQLNRGFFTNGRAGTVTAFDTNSLKLLTDIKAGENPDAIIYDEFSKEVIVMNGRSKDVMVIDPAQMKVVATVPLGGKLEYAATDESHLYVNVENTAEIAVVDTRSWKPLQRWKLSGCEEPTGLAIDRASGHLFSACSNERLLVVDTKNGAAVATLRTDARTDGAAFDPGLKLAFASNGQGTLTVVQQAVNGRYEVAESVATQRGARTMTLDIQSHTIYLPTAEQQSSAELGALLILVVAPKKR